MNALLFIVVVSTIIKYTVDPIKKFIEWFIFLFDNEKRIKFGVPIAFVIGIASGITSNQGTVQAILEAFKIDYTLSEMFHYVDVFYTCMLVTGISGGVMKALEGVQISIKKIISNWPTNKQ